MMIDSSYVVGIAVENGSDSTSEPNDAHSEEKTWDAAGAPEHDESIYHSTKTGGDAGMGDAGMGGGAAVANGVQHVPLFQMHPLLALNEKV